MTFYADSDLTATIDSYMSGNGVPTIARWPSLSTPPEDADFVPLGEVTQFEFTPKVTKKNHKSRSTGVQAIDDRVSVYQEGELKITLSNFLKQNLILYFMAELNEDGTSGEFMQGLDYVYYIRFDQVLRRGSAKRYNFYKCDITPAAALQLLADGEGEGDWGKLELSVFMLKDATLGWGGWEVAPTT